MFIEFLGAIWRRLPSLVRRRLIRSGQRRFTVTAGAMIFDDQGRILLLEHVFRPDSGWGIPGGFLTKGEQPDAALRRELREEIGIEVENVELLFARALPTERQIEIYFRAEALGTPEPCSFEIRSAGWFPVSDLPAELSKDQRRLIQRALGSSENSFQ
ncbi:MAG: 8-oxo-dGTP diphosphatase [Blastocatellia bacterium]|jgi:ADP-ribose pyrophosphatase YjhB (NUDIX family)|nr:8-oxo-dGTP diphosphatase [Blastocatellia bacterium]